MNVYFLLFNIALAFAGDVKPEFVHDLLSASEHETHLNEDLAKLLEIEYERQGSCGTSVTSTCCSSCAYDGSCYNGGYCCESSSVRTKMLKFGENECPNSWQSDCKLTKMIPIEGCDKSTKHRQHHKIKDSSDSDTSSSEDRLGLRVMCLCLQTKRCCFGPLPTPPTTTGTTYLTETTSWPWWWFASTTAAAPYAETTSLPWWFATTTTPATTTTTARATTTTTARATTTTTARATTTKTGPTTSTARSTSAATTTATAI